MVSGRFHALSIKRSEGVESDEVVSDEMRDRYIRKNDIIAHLSNLYIDAVNNHDDWEVLLHVLYNYRELFIYISNFPRENFFIDRQALINSIDTIKEMERKISLTLIKKTNVDITEIKKPLYLKEKIPEKFQSFLENKEAKFIVLYILTSFETNLKLSWGKNAIK